MKFLFPALSTESWDLFSDDFHAETFVTISLISADKDIIPDALAGLAASAALAISDIPFNGPISEVRVARVGKEFIINPTATQLKDADIDLMVGATFWQYYDGRRWNERSKWSRYAGSFWELHMMQLKSSAKLR